MATIVHTELKTSMVGNATHSFVDWNTDNIDGSLLDQTDSGTITAATVDYDDVDTAVVVKTADLVISGIVGGVVSSTAGITFTAVTGDAADYLTIWKNSGTPSTSPLCITFDSATTGLPVTPNGEDIIVTFAGNVVLTVA